MTPDAYALETREDDLPDDALDRVVLLLLDAAEVERWIADQREDRP